MLTRILALIAVLLLAPSTLAHANARALSLESASPGIFAGNVGLLKEIPELTHCCIKEKSTEQAESSNRREEYLRARYMDPGQGRFLGMDKFAGSTSSPATLHKYAYANQSPAIYSDPSGYAALTMELQAIEARAIIAQSAIAGIRIIRAIRIATNAVDIVTQINDAPMIDRRLGLRYFPLALTIARTCLKSGAFRANDCDLDDPVFIIGSTTPRHREIVTKALIGGATNILTRREPPFNRAWLTCIGSVIGDGLDCDEYPFASTHQGGKDGITYAELNTPHDNRTAGALLLSTLYERCPVRGSEATGDAFAVIPIIFPSTPTIGICGN